MSLNTLQKLKKVPIVPHLQQHLIFSIFKEIVAISMGIVLSCILLKTTDVEHLYWLFFWELSVQIFYLFFIRLFLLLNYKNSMYILDLNSSPFLIYMCIDYLKSMCFDYVYFRPVRLWLTFSLS